MIRNDFLCRGKCKTAEGAALYADLPSDSTRCPVCGSKRFDKIFASNFAVKGVAKHVDALVEPAYTAQAEVRDAAKASRLEAAKSRHPGVVAAHASQLGPALARATGMPAFGAASAGPNKPADRTGAVLGSALPAGGAPIPGLTRPRPRPGSPAWSGR